MDPEEVGDVTVSAVVSATRGEIKMRLFLDQPRSFIPVLDEVLVNKPIIVAAITTSASTSSSGIRSKHGREYRHLFRLL
jgi:hypothetical protein